MPGHKLEINNPVSLGLIFAQVGLLSAGTKEVSQYLKEKKKSNLSVTSFKNNLPHESERLPSPSSLPPTCKQKLVQMLFFLFT
jgi:hypothetical protein